MTRFADPKATKRFVLGACECPETPHTEDWIEFRTELGAADSMAIAQSDAPNYEALNRLIVGWNIQDATGQVPPTDREHIELLFPDIFDKFEDFLNASVRATAKPLPNASAARSRSSTGASGSPTPNPKRVNSSTTSYSPPVDGATTTSGWQPTSS